ncbi:hypothetical protein HALLA_01730 (plasmid) [Halostagnicola larsenii XH-48]|uniref:Uncharacterized protein n=1 Tax=Halostagnicola larsenii XH-48 TaxID=797299 RepID=W0JYG2_9EURY|nr:hypothetical protein HALLA_01730 [Halostagnicola larsenii XH-48]
MIRLDDEQYCPYQAVDSKSNYLLYTTLERTSYEIITSAFSGNSSRNTTLTTPCFSSMALTH